MASLGTLSVTVGAAIDGFEKSMGTVSQRLNAIDREATKAFSGFEKVGQRLTTIGSGLTAAITLPLAGAAIAATKFAADFELGMRQVTSLLGGATKQEFENLSKRTLDLSRAMGIDAVKASNALYEAISAGVPKENAIEFLAVASKAAIAGVTDTKVAVDALTTVLAAYNLDISEAGKVSDALFQAVNVGKTTFPQLAAAIGPAAAQAKNLGISYEELLAATATLSITSGGVSIAVTQIESSMRALLQPTKEMQAALKGLGFETGEAAVKTLGYEGLLQKLREQTGGSAEAFNALFGRIEGYNAAIGLTGERSATAAKDLATLRNATGAADKAFQEIDKTTTRQFERLSAELHVTAIEMGTALLPAVNSLLKSSRPLVEAIASAVSWFTKLPEPVKTSALGIVALVAAIGPLVIVAGQATVAISGMAKAVIFLTETGILAWTSEFARAVTGNMIGPLTAGQTSLVKFAGLLKGIAVPVTVGIVVHQALSALLDTKTATDNLNKALEKKKENLEILNDKWRENEVAMGRLFPKIEAGKDSVLEFARGLKNKTDTLGTNSKALTVAEQATKKFREAVEEEKKKLKESAEQAKIHEQAMRELGLSTDKTTTKAREFLDLQPVLAAKMRIVESEYKKNVEELAKLQLALERAGGTILTGVAQLDQLALAAGRLGAEVGNLGTTISELPQMPGYTGTIKELDDLGRAYERMGVTSTGELRRMRDQALADFNTIKNSGVATARELEAAWLKWLEAAADAAHQAGEDIPIEIEGILQATGKKTKAGLTEQEKHWKTFAKQVSTIISDLGKDLASGTINLVKGLLGFDDFNKKLAADSAELRRELGERSEAIDQFTRETQETINGINSKYADQLAKETGELQASLAERQEEYAAFVISIGESLETLRHKEAARLFDEQHDLAEKLADKEGEYERYVGQVAEKEQDIRRTHEDQLRLQLRSLQESLADRVQAYDDYVADANQKLSRIGIDLNETIRDATRSINRRIEDENTDFARDQEKLGDDLREAEAKGDKKRVAEIRRSLGQREQDHSRSIRRLQEDLAEQVRDARIRAAEQTADLKVELDRRKRDHKEYLAENARSQAETTAKHKAEQAEQLADLQKSLDERTAALLAFREETAAGIAAAGVRSAARLAEEEAELQASLKERAAKLTAYGAEVAAKIEALTAKYTAEQAKEVAALELGLANKLAEYDKYRAGVEQKLLELEAAHKGPLDRIREMFTTVFESAANAILRLASEEVLGKLIGKLTSLAVDILPGIGKAAIDNIGAIGSAAADASKAVADILGGGARVAGEVGGGIGDAAGQIGGSLPGQLPGGAGAAGGAAGMGVQAIAGIVTGAISAVSGVIGNFQMAGMNKSLDLIEHETRFSQIHLKELVERGQNLFLSQLPPIYELTRQFVGDHAWRIHDVWDRLGNIHELIAFDTNSLLSEIRDSIRAPRITTSLEAAGHPGYNITITGNTFRSRDDIDYAITQISRNLR